MNTQNFMKLIFRLIFVFVSFQTFGTDFEASPAFQKGYNEVFRLELNSARTTIGTLKRTDPFRMYLENYVEFVELFNSDNPTAYKQQLQNEDKRLEIIEDLDENSPYNRFLQSEILLQWALLKIRNGHELKAVHNVIKAAKLLEENQKLFPKFLPNNKSLGTLHIIIGSVPDNFKWALKILGLKGNVKLGISELEKATKDPVWGNEARYCSLFIQSFLLKFDEKDNQKLLSFVETNPQNANVRFIATSISLKNNRADQADKILSRMPKGEGFLHLHILDSYRGDIALARGNYYLAKQSYSNFVKSYNGRTFLKDAFLKLFYSYYLDGEMEKSRIFLAKVNSVGHLNSELDKAALKNAESYLKANVLPDKNLLTAKLALEGGYENLAQEKLKSINPNSLGSLKEKIEYNYLKGRVLQTTGKPDLAIGFFDNTILLNEKEPSSFGANSALQIGYIYQGKGQNSNAKAYFIKAISYKNHEMKNTIDGKSRAALTEMGYLL